MCEWITKNLGKDVPLHFSRFFPYYKMNNVDPTPKETLLKAKEIAKKAGINHIYLGNIMLVEQGNTFCSKCGKVIIKRNMYDVATNNLKKGKCDCGTKIPGVWT